MYIIIHIFLIYYALVLPLSTLPIGVHTYQLVYILSSFTYQCQTTSPDKCCLFYHGYFMREKEYIYIYIYF